MRIPASWRTAYAPFNFANVQDATLRRLEQTVNTARARTVYINGNVLTCTNAVPKSAECTVRSPGRRGRISRFDTDALPTSSFQTRDMRCRRPIFACEPPTPQPDREEFCLRAGNVNVR